MPTYWTKFRLILSNRTIGTYKIHCSVKWFNTLIEHSRNKNFTLGLFILENNNSIMGSMKSMIGKNFGKFSKAFWANF